MCCDSRSYGPLYETGNVFKSPRAPTYILHAFFLLVLILFIVVVFLLVVVAGNTGVELASLLRADRGSHQTAGLWGPVSIPRQEFWVYWFSLKCTTGVRSYYLYNYNPNTDNTVSLYWNGPSVYNHWMVRWSVQLIWRSVARCPIFKWDAEIWSPSRHQDTDFRDGYRATLPFVWAHGAR